MNVFDIKKMKFIIHLFNNFHNCKSLHITMFLNEMNVNVGFIVNLTLKVSPPKMAKATR